MRRLGIVDVGSNTIRLVVYARRGSGTFRLVDDLHERVGLGAGAFRDGAIQEDRLQQAITLLRRFADYSHGARLDDVEVIGTSAMRDTRNGNVLVREARQLGLDVTVLSGEDEARYGALAVANSFDIDDAWVMDLGGGSAQISRMEGRQWVDGHAYPLGALRLTDSFLTSDPPTAAEVAALEAAVAESLSAVVAEMREWPAPLIVMGGAVRNLGRAVQRRDSYPLEILHGYWFNQDDLESLTDELLAASSAERAAIPGIVRGRADVIHAAAAVFRWLVRAIGRQGLVVSGRGLREGALFCSELRSPHLVRSVGQATVAGLMEQYVADHRHAELVRDLSGRLFEALHPLHGLDPRDRIVLEVGALLHEVGMAVDFFRRQQHGALLLSSVAMDGFTHREQVLIMLLVRYHHKGTPNLEKWQALLPNDRQRLLAMIACIRLARAMNRSRGGRIVNFDVMLNDETIVVRLAVPEACWAEIDELSLQTAIVDSAFGLRLVVEPVETEISDPDPRLRPRYEEA